MQYKLWSIFQDVWFTTALETTIIIITIILRSKEKKINTLHICHSICWKNTLNYHNVHYETHIYKIPYNFSTHNFLYIAPFLTLFVQKKTLCTISLYWKKKIFVPFCKKNLHCLNLNTLIKHLQYTKSFKKKKKFFFSFIQRIPVIIIFFFFVQNEYSHAFFWYK